jgi:uncharacterized protein (DUF1697 family)
VSAVGESAVYLLRAVNLGARNKVPMPRLRALVEELGGEQVATFITSGNVRCVAPGAADAFARKLEDAIATQFGVGTTVLHRSRSQLIAARKAFPFDVHEPRFCSIAFLERRPTRAQAAALAAEDFGPDRAAVVGAELHLRYAAVMGGSKITSAKLRRLIGTDGTLRNLRTVDGLIDLLA